MKHLKTFENFSVLEGKFKKFLLDIHHQRKRPSKSKFFKN
jgi:hypothetical protein